jgi:hypothetical protein
VKKALSPGQARRVKRSRLGIQEIQLVFFDDQDVDGFDQQLDLVSGFEAELI